MFHAILCGTCQQTHEEQEENRLTLPRRLCVRCLEGIVWHPLASVTLSSKHLHDCDAFMDVGSGLAWCFNLLSARWSTSQGNPV